MPEEKPAKASNGSENKLLAALGYIIGILIPLFVIFTEKKNDKFLAFHAWQSLILSIVWIVIFVGLTGLTIVAGALTAGIGSLVGCLSLPAMLVWFLMIIIGAWKAYQGEKYMFPVIGEFAQKQVK